MLLLGSVVCMKIHIFHSCVVSRCSHTILVRLQKVSVPSFVWSRLLGKSSQTGQPLSNIVKEHGRKGVARLHIIVCLSRPFGCNSDAGGNLQQLFAAINFNAVELCVVTNVEVQGSMNGHKEPNIAIECNL